jgi:hypothetical protein
MGCTLRCVARLAIGTGNRPTRLEQNVLYNARSLECLDFKISYWILTLCRQ